MDVGRIILSLPDIVFDQQARSNGVHAIPARVIASCFALACFAGSVIFGAYNGNSALSILGGALVAMFLAFFVGLILGSLAQRCVDDHIKQHKADNPLPTDTKYVADVASDLDDSVEIIEPDAGSMPAGT